MRIVKVTEFFILRGGTNKKLKDCETINYLQQAEKDVSEDDTVKKCGWKEGPGFSFCSVLFFSFAKKKWTIWQWVRDAIVPIRESQKISVMLTSLPRWWQHTYIWMRKQGFVLCYGKWFVSCCGLCPYELRMKLAVTIYIKQKLSPASLLFNAR